MVGGRDYNERAVQPRHPGPAPAGLGVQALHPGRGAARGDRPGLGVAVAQARVRRAGHEGQGEVRRQQLRGRLRRASRRWPARRRSPTTRSSPQVGIKVGTEARRADGRAHGHPHAGVVQPGDDARRPARGRHAARHGARLRDVRQRRRRVGGTLGAPATGRAGRASDRSTHGRRRPIETNDVPTAQARSTARTAACRRERRGRSALAGPVESAPARARRTASFAAGKTGTTENCGDAWFVGFTERGRSRSGSATPTSSSRWRPSSRGEPVAGGTYPALIWRDFMVAANAIADAKADEERARRAGRQGRRRRPDADAARRPPAPPPSPRPAPEDGRRARAGRRPAGAPSRAAARRPRGADAGAEPPARRRPRRRRRRRRRPTTAAAAPAAARRPTAAPRVGRHGVARSAAPASGRDTCGCPRAEAPRQLDGLRDADARAGHDARAPARPRGGGSRRSARRRGRGVELQLDAERLRELARARAEVVVALARRGARASARCPSSGSSARISTAAPDALAARRRR